MVSSAFVLSPVLQTMPRRLFPIASKVLSGEAAW